MHGCEMPLEDIGAVKALLSGRPRARTEAADHGALVMGEGMPVFVIFSGKSLLIVLAIRDGAFFWSLGLVCQHMGLEVFKDSSTVPVWASSFLVAFFIELGHARHG